MFVQSCLGAQCLFSLIWVRSDCSDLSIPLLRILQRFALFSRMTVVLLILSMCVSVSVATNAFEQGMIHHNAMAKFVFFVRIEKKLRSACPSG